MNESTNHTVPAVTLASC